MTKKTAKKTDKNFEKSLKRLEEIVDEMENADPDLDKALELFTEGVELVRFCSTKLEDTKRKVEILVKENGIINKEILNGEEEDN